VLEALLAERFKASEALCLWALDQQADVATLPNSTMLDFNIVKQIEVMLNPCISLGRLKGSFKQIAPAVYDSI
jgi:hypothetical protein